MTSEAEPGSKRSILVVDDNVDEAMTLILFLRLKGHSVYIAHDGPQAVRSAYTNSPEVTLLHIDLPTLNGYDVAKRIRAERWGKRMVIDAVTERLVTKIDNGQRKPGSTSTSRSPST